MYAAVAKKIPQSDNNSNLYADVTKSGRHDTNKGTMISEVKPKKGTIKKCLLTMPRGKVNKC